MTTLHQIRHRAPQSFCKWPILSSVLIAASKGDLQAGPGDLDSTFGTGGKMILEFGIQSSRAWAVATQPDGKVVVAGNINNETSFDWAVARFRLLGGLDETFADGGKAVIAVPGGLADVTAIALTPQSKIVVVGSDASRSQRRLAVIVLNPEGSLDTSFGSSGLVTLDVGAYETVASSVVVRANGKIIVGGWTSNNSNVTSRNFMLVRFNLDGTLDASFGSGGAVVTDFFSQSRQDVGEGVILQPDGKIVLAGRHNNGTSGSQFAMARYMPNGSLDSSFGSGGLVTTYISLVPGYSSAQAEAIALQSDGRIVLAGYASDANRIYFCVARYTTSGTLDSSFGGTGFLTTAVTAHSDYGRSVFVQADGKIIVGGYSRDNPPTNEDFILARYSADGTLDSTFGTGGKAVTDFSSTYDHLNSMALQADGKIFAVGYVNSPTYTHFGIARYDGDPSAYTDFELWRLNWFGVTGDIGQAAELADPDGDGQDNFFERTAGTNPTNRASRFILYPPIVQALQSQKLVRFEPAFTDRTYVIESSIDLKNWFPLGSPLTGLSGTYDYLDSSAGGPWKFYRVRISRP